MYTPLHERLHYERYCTCPHTVFCSSSVLYLQCIVIFFHRSSGSYPYTLKVCCHGNSHVSWQGILHHTSRDDQGHPKRKLQHKLQVVHPAKMLHQSLIPLMPVKCNVFLSNNTKSQKRTVVMLRYQQVSTSKILLLLYCLYVLAPGMMNLQLFQLLRTPLRRKT